MYLLLGSGSPAVASGRAAVFSPRLPLFGLGRDRFSHLRRQGLGEALERLAGRQPATAQLYRFEADSLP
jgi:hypothetical protein